MLEKAGLAFSGSEGPGIWVSTQIAEASLGIDFDLLFTEMCAADSLLQRLGRCFRGRNLNVDGPNIFIYNTVLHNGRGTVYDSGIYDRSVEMLVPCEGSLFTEQDKQEYITRVYDVEALRAMPGKNTYYRELSSELRRISNILPMALSRPEAQQNFREINSVSVMDEKTFTELLSDGTLERLKADIASGNKKLRAKAEPRQFVQTVQKSSMSRNIEF